MEKSVRDHCYAAVDIGASSGRVIVGTVTDGVIGLKEVYRFDNGQQRLGGHDCWNVESLFQNVVAGLAAAKEQGYEPTSIGIDTWAVDFVLLDEKGEMVGDAVAYRDARTDGMYEVADALMSPERHYALTGIQRQPFNTIYQLLALKREHPEQLERAARLLMIPDYLNWRLTGKAVNEYTNASTTGLVNARTCDWDPEILEAVGISAELFAAPAMPGAVVGGLLPEIQDRVGYNAEVMLPATHDTGSAYLAVPARDEHAVFLSSGTWSLMGVENAEPITSEASRLQNFTNEGGYEKRYRYLKNIMGLWMIQSVRRELNGVDYVEGKHADGAAALKDVENRTYGFGDLIELARAAEPFEAVVDVDDDAFLAPDSMIRAIQDMCRATGQPVPETVGQVMRTIYCSLAHTYARAIKGLEELTGNTYTSVNIVGGGCQDGYLNQMCANACGLPVFAGPVEGTSLGNLMVQMIHAGEFSGISEARAAIARSFDVVLVDPVQ